LRWFDLRARQIGSWAFVLNRITALGLTFYLGLHLVVLNRFAQGPQAYDDFLTFAHLPVIKLGELVLVMTVLFHGLNGVRVILHALGVGLRNQKSWILIVAMITLGGGILFGLRLFSGVIK
jgi:succinate dehydrogenase / fumarate reductase, cytochrome b subunit